MFAFDIIVVVVVVVVVGGGGGGVVLSKHRVMLCLHCLYYIKQLWMFRHTHPCHRGENRAV